jgi:hypothetical protein
MALAWGHVHGRRLCLLSLLPRVGEGLFTEALGQEVEVELVQAIGRGTSVVSPWSTPDVGGVK